MKTKFLILLFNLFVYAAKTQNNTALQYANKIDSVRMKTSLTKLASSEFLGRKSDGKGAILTAEYLETQLNIAKIKGGNNGSYKQNIEAFNSVKANKYFKLKDLNYTSSFSYRNNTYQDSVIFGQNIVFAGYGVHHSTFNDFANIDIKGKIVMVLEGGGPQNKYGVNCHSASDVPDIKYIVSQSAKAVLLVKQGFNTFYNYSSEGLNFYNKYEIQTLPNAQINELLANRLLEPVDKTIKQLQYEIESSCSSASFEFNNEIIFNGESSYQLSSAHNIVAIVEGSDLKDEFVVLSAHYDHIGSNYHGDIYHGADDNASGVAAVMEISRVLNEAKNAGKGPRRSIIILFPTAEEDGLYGSNYYIQKPVFPLEKTIACVNIDMLGRTGDNIEPETIKKGYVYALTGTNKINSSLFNITDSINAIATKLTVLSTEGSNYNNLFERSDHYNFYMQKIPSILFTNGIHEDLHKTTDTVEKIDFRTMLNRTKLAFLTIWELANKPRPFN